MSPINKISGTVSNCIYNIFQDSRGYIWVGTDRGVSRYDGRVFRHYTKDDGLSDHEVFQIYEDGKGRIWCLGLNGYPSVIDGNRVYNYKCLSFLKDVSFTAEATGFCATGDTIRYLTRTRAYVFVKDKLLLQIDSIPECPGKLICYSGFIDSNNFKVLTNRGIWNMTTGSFAYFKNGFTLNTEKSKATRIGKKLLFFDLTKVYILDLQTYELKIVELPDHDNAVDFIFNPAIDHEAWICCDRNIYTIDLRFFSFHVSPILTGSYFSWVLKDRDNHYWLASLTQGLFFAYNKHYGYIDYATRIGTRNASSVLYDAHTGDLYAGYDNGEFLKFRNGKIVEVYTARLKTGRKIIMQFCRKGKDIWVAGGNLLFYVNEGNLHKVKEFLGNVKAIAIPDSFFYLALSNKVVRVRRDSMAYYGANNYYGYAHTIYSGIARSVAYTRDRVLIIGTAEGVFFYDNGRLRKITDPQPISSSYVSSVVEVDTNTIAFATLGSGVSILKNGRLTTITKRDGLSSNICNKLSVDVSGNIWVATQTGLDRLVPYGIPDSIRYVVQNFSHYTRLFCENINDVSIGKDTVWVASNNGVFYFRSNEVSRQTKAPPVHIEYLAVNDHIYNADSLIKLQYNENTVRIGFSGISFLTGDIIRYRYRLMGGKNIWQYTRGDFIQYAELQPDDYVFEVSASVDGVKWSKPAHIIFTVKEAYWQTWWFTVLYILTAAMLLFFVIYLIYRIRYVQAVSRLRNRNMQLEKEQQQHALQLSALEQKALRLQMNPHFIFNAINSIKGYYASGNTLGAKEFINRFAMLMRSILESSKMNNVSLSKEIILLCAYLDFYQLRYHNSFTYTISYGEHLNTETIFIPALLLQPIIENTVLHGLVPLEKPGKLDLYFGIEKDMFTAIITDNGIGRAKAKELNKYRVGESSGISLVKERLKLLTANMQGDYLFQIEDLFDASGEASGTRVTIQIPI